MAIAVPFDAISVNININIVMVKKNKNEIIDIIFLVFSFIIPLNLI